MLGIIGGTSLLNYCGTNLEKKLIHTPYGSSELLMNDEYILLLRHQFRNAPHKINYRSHIASLILAGVTHLISIGSVGSLKKQIIPGSMLIPDDFLAYAKVPTIFNHSIGHVKPEINPDLMQLLHTSLPDAVLGGTYLQTSGPRLETKAEIQWFTSAGDVVGMTVASEATLATEMNLPFAAICTVDNYANGICEEDVTYESIIAHAKIYHNRTLKMLENIIEKCRNLPDPQA